MKDWELMAGLFLPVIGGLLMAIGILRFRRLRQIQDTASIPIASAPQGFVEVAGFAWPARRSVDSLLGQPCVWRHLVLEERVGIDKYEERFEHCTTNPFYVLDASGLALVRPYDAEIDADTAEIHGSRLGNRERARAEEIVGGGVKGWPPRTGRWNYFRFQERKIRIGTPVLVHGVFRSGASAKEVRGDLPLSILRSHVRQVGFDRSARVAPFDVNRDGTARVTGVSAGFAAAAAQALRSALRPTSSTPRDSAPASDDVIRVHGEFRSEPDRPLFLANCHEHQLVEQLGRHNFLLIVAGAVMVGAGAWFLFGHR